MRQMLHFWSLLLVLALVGCSGGAVVFAPTAIPPDLAPARYSHPSGAFEVVLPPTWSVFNQQVSVYASTSFAPPASDAPLVQVVVINLGSDIQLDQLSSMMDQYQSQFRPDIARYTEQNRQAMGDGSWRITGLRTTTSGQTQEVNTFLQRSGSMLAVIEVTLPVDAGLRTQIQTIINTLVINPSADLPVETLASVAGLAPSELEIINLSTWTTPENVFFVTGEVANHGTVALKDVPIRAMLLTEDGITVADGLDVVMGYGIDANGFAPFSIRFGQGQPINATRYTVSLGSADYVPQTVTIVTSPILVWTDSTQTTADGDLFVTGAISNTGAEDVRAPRAIATIFDDRGRVIGAGFADADDSLLRAGESLNFTILISDLGGTPANYVVNVQAYPCDASCE